MLDITPKEFVEKYVIPLFLYSSECIVVEEYLEMRKFYPKSALIGDSQLCFIIKPIFNYNHTNPEVFWRYVIYGDESVEIFSQDSIIFSCDYEIFEKINKITI